MFLSNTHTYQLTSLFLSFLPLHYAFVLPQSKNFASHYSVMSPLSMNGGGGDRAHTDKLLEDMMGDDWRTFRAKLVQQEKSNCSFLLSAQETNMDKKSSCDNSFNNNSNDKNHQQQSAPLGKFVSGAISSIFNKGESSSTSATASSSSMRQQPSITDIVMNGINDPFAGEREIPALIGEAIAKESFDNHRWAHQLDHIEPGCVLVANEKLGGVFHQTVLLMIDHNDRDGSLAIVINRPLPGTLVDIASGPEAHIDAGLRTAFNGAKVSYGGPVMQDEYSVLHGWGEVEGSKKVAPGVFVGGSSELAFEVRRNNFDPTEALFIKGHAAWVPNQLNREILRGVWYVASVSSDFILRYAGAPQNENDNPDDLWADILSAMGGHFHQIAKAYAGPGDKRMKQP